MIITRSAKKRMVIPLIAWTVGFLYTLTKGALGNALGSDLVDVDLLTVLTAYLFLFHGFGSAGVFAFGQGVAVDLFSVGTHGVSAFAYLCVFLGLIPGSWYINLQHRGGQILLVTLVALLKKVLFFAMLRAAYSGAMEWSGPVIWISGFSVLATGIMAWPIFSILDRTAGPLEEEEESGTVGE